jgi:hypothetical protein
MVSKGIESFLEENNIDRNKVYINSNLFSSDYFLGICTRIVKVNPELSRSQVGHAIFMYYWNKENKDNE